MDFELNEDQRMLADTVSSFAKQSSPLARFRKLRDDECGWDPAVWRQMGELGWLSVPFPEEVDGLGGSFVEVAVILECLAATLVPEPYVPSVVLGGYALLLAGSLEQQKRFLPPMMEGRTSLALAHAERTSRYDSTVVRTMAKRAGESWTLTGEKEWVLNGHAADEIVVSASTPDGLALFVVPRDAAGLTLESLRTLDGHHAARARLEGVAVGADRLLGEPGAGAGTLDRLMDLGATAACAEGVGIAQAMLAMTVEYLKTRQQFGVKIGAFQVLQHRAVDMFIEVEVCRSMTMEAVMRVGADDDDERRAAVSAAKAQLAVGGRFVANQSIQLHGGVGCTDEHDIGLYFKRMRALNSLFGDEEHHVARYGALDEFTAGLE